MTKQEMDIQLIEATLLELRQSFLFPYFQKIIHGEQNANLRRCRNHYNSFNRF
jgi:hypothetical protein